MNTRINAPENANNLKNVDVKETAGNVEFVDFVKAFLRAQKSSGLLALYLCNISVRTEDTSSFINGKRHSKAPGQNNFICEVDLQCQLSSKKAVAFVFQGANANEFVEAFESAQKWAVEIPHAPRVVKQKSYPQLKLMSPQLLDVFGRHEAAATLAKVAAWLDEEAATITHPLLVNREVTASLSLSTRLYLDSSGNEATEQSASCSLMCSFSLVDSSEYFADAVGVLPTQNDCRNVVHEAAKNLQNTAVKKFEPQPECAVLLSPKAVVTLVSALILPNLEVRSILDATGAFDVQSLGKKVLANLTVSDNPHLEFSPFSAAFDMEGTPSKPVTLMSNGVLKHPLFTSALLAELQQEHSALAAQFELTGHADSADSASLTNTFLEFTGTPAASVAEMLLGAGQVVFINGLTGMSVDPLTGQFALDAEGAKVYEGGKLVCSTSVTLRGNFFEALAAPDNRVGQSQRCYNMWAPELFTRHLACVAKEMANEADSVEQESSL